LLKLITSKPKGHKCAAALDQIARLIHAKNGRRRLSKMVASADALDVAPSYPAIIREVAME
jgi:hypothetical protein